MALKGLDIFKLSPKKNCKECGSPTCMAFCMKVAQGDTDLQMPILAAVCNDTWGVKESTATVEDEPAWGCQEERAISMEVATAAADLTGGADAVVLRHPASVAAIKKFITELV